jgi:hypothetical protein
MICQAACSSTESDILTFTCHLRIRYAPIVIIQWYSKLLLFFVKVQFVVDTLVLFKVFLLFEFEF